jgi:hypothetical protein
MIRPLRSTLSTLTLLLISGAARAATPEAAVKGG